MSSLIIDRANPDKLMIQTQAEIINRMHKENADMRRAYREEIAELHVRIANTADAARYYQQIQNLVHQDDNVRSEWERFVACIKLFMDDPEKQCQQEAS
jgi:hypothetical protein